MGVNSNFVYIQVKLGTILLVKAGAFAAKGLVKLTETGDEICYPRWIKPIEQDREWVKYKKYRGW